MKILRHQIILLVTLVALGAAGDVIVKTRQGKISGLKETSTKGREFYSFRAIPYAKPPVGNLRLKDPVEGDPWEEILDGSQDPAICPQIFHSSIDEDEDCLYLNVFTHKPNELTANIPVMVYIHGGAFYSGSSSYFQPNFLLNADIIFVTIQYRLGVLGFLSTEDSVIPGNFGLKDQTLALEWLQKNIGFFGGDKNRVTIFGDSAGAASIHLQIMTQKSQGLFLRAIMQSGSALCPWSQSFDMEAVKNVAQQLNCDIGRGSETFLKCLQEVNVYRFAGLATQNQIWSFNPVTFGPRVDGEYLTTDTELLMRKGTQRKVDVIIGFNRDEGALYSYPLFTNQVMMENINDRFSMYGPIATGVAKGQTQVAKQIYKYYMGDRRVDEKTANQVTEMFGDGHFIMPVDLTAEGFLRWNGNAKTYLYELTHRGQHTFGDQFNSPVGKHWISHMDFIQYFFGTSTLTQVEDIQLSHIMLKTWVNFATYGNPTPDESLGFKWEPASKDNLQHLALQPKPRMVDDQRLQKREFWSSLPTKQNLLLHPHRISYKERILEYANGPMWRRPENDTILQPL